MTAPRALTDSTRRARELFAAHDPGYGALRRAVRTAIVMPGVFALCLKVIGNPVMAPFAAFGAISTLLLVDFRGTITDRARSQSALVVAGAALVCVGTLCSRSTVAAVVAMAVLGTVISFAGVVSATLTAATAPLLLGFILPVSLPGAASQIPDRIAGWGLAGGLSVLAVCLLWPAPVADPLRSAVLAAARALAACLRGDEDRETAAQRADQARDALAAMGNAFLATPYRPTALTTGARAGVRLVDELRWLGRIVVGPQAEPSDGPLPAPAQAVRLAAGAVLEQGIALLGEQPDARQELARARQALDAITGALVEQVSIPHAARVRTHDSAPTVELEVAAFSSALDPAFRAQEASFMVSQIAANIEVIAAANGRTWPQRLLGRQPPGIGGPLSSIRERAGAHLALGSVAARNALRAGVALGIAVLAARLLGVEHAFWVSFGTLSILRSNALSTGQTFARALGGTVLGFLVGAGLVLAIGTNVTVLWVLLPIAVLFGGIAPAAISFLAGQAAFTVVLFILFNILAPAGWQIGLVRLEDVALGGAASLVVGLVFWPRGAGQALTRALADAYTTSTAYLTSAIARAVTCCAPGIVAAPAGGREATEAAASARRLDDTFRTYLAERGAKRLGLARTSMLVTGPLVLRLAADAILELWADSGETSQSRVAASRELLSRAQAVQAWYGTFGRALVAVGAGAGARHGTIPDPEPPSPLADQRLLAAIDRDLRSADGATTVTAVQIAWTGDHLDAARRLEAALVTPAREAIAPDLLGGSAGWGAWVGEPLSAFRRRRDGARAARHAAPDGLSDVAEPRASAAPARDRRPAPAVPAPDDRARRAPHT
jgi:uncharacterized membrane protein YccC